MMVNQDLHWIWVINADKAFELVEVFKTDKDNAEDKNEIIEHKEMLPAEARDVMHLLHQLNQLRVLVTAIKILRMNY